MDEEKLIISDSDSNLKSDSRELPHDSTESKDETILDITRHSHISTFGSNNKDDSRSIITTAVYNDTVTINDDSINVISDLAGISNKSNIDDMIDNSMNSVKSQSDAGPADVHMEEFGGNLETPLEIEQQRSQYSYIVDWCQTPTQVCCSNEFSEDNYLKGCKWSPDGTCLLTNSHDHHLRLFNLPSRFYTNDTQDDEHITEMRPVLSIDECGIIYDYCWYPRMSSSDPSTCCFVCTSKDTPIHMYDAYTGDIKASYKAYNHVDELVAAHSLCFSHDGTKLLCGFHKMIRVFDINTPGRHCVERKTYNKEGQSGIISCIAVSPGSDELYAAGSYSRQIALYSEPWGAMVCMFEAQQGGVTHLQFSPDGQRLYSGGRKDPEILCWDLRNPGHILFSAIRVVQTNQRMYFQIDDTGKWLMSGNHDGTVTVWDTTAPPLALGGTGDPILPTKLVFPAHTDTVNGLSFHPTLPAIATTSGQRHYTMPDDSSGSDENDDVIDTRVDNSLKMWLFPPLRQT